MRVLGAESPEIRGLPLTHGASIAGAGSTDDAPPAEPRSCGSDPTDDELGCASYSPCGG